MAGPWEKYGQTAPAAGKPWERYGAPSNQQAIRVTIQPPPANPPPAEEQGGSARDIVETGVGGFIEGLPIVGPVIRRGAEMAAAATDAAFSDRTYEDNMRFIDEDRARLKEAHPVIDTASQIAGGVAGTVPMVAAAPAVFGATGRNLLTRTAAAAGSGAAVSGADAAVRSGGDLTQTGIGAGAGLVLGAAGPAAAKAIGKGAQAVFNRGADKAASRAAEGAPTTDFLKEQAGQLFEKARQAGVVVKPEAYQGFLVNTIRGLRSEGVDRTLHPRVIAAAQRLAEAADGPLTFENLETLRRIVGGAASSIDPDERRIASILKDSLDDWMENLPPSAVASGDARAASGMLREARNLWGQARRGDIIEKIIADAQADPPRMEMLLRNGFKALGKNDKKLRGFSEVEKRAIRAVGAGTPVERVLRLLGKAAPTGVVSGGLSALAGGAAGGVPGAIATLAVGEGAKRGSDAITRRLANTASGVVRMGRDAQKALPKPRQVDEEKLGRRASSVLLGLTPAINSR